MGKSLKETAMRTHALAVVLALVCMGCGDKSPETAQGGAAQQTSTVASLDKWSWLPRSTVHDAEASSISKDAQVFYRIPQDDPLDAKSAGGWGGIDTNGNFVPTDKKSYVVTGGTLISQIGAVQRRAKYGDWDVVYSDAERTKRAGWGHCLTSGEIVVPRSAFGDPPSSLFVQNSYEAETFGDAFVLIRLDPAKGQKLCFMTNANSDVSTVGFVGTKASVRGKVLERKADGWYSEARRVSE